MMLESGQWLGRGSLLAEGQSRGLPLECELQIERDADGVTLTGEWQIEGEAAQGIAIRLASNDVGTYTLSARLGPRRLDGTAKLDSPPNLGLVWEEDEGRAGNGLYATFALFSISRGYGCRGFLRDADAAGTRRVFTWEIAFSLKQDVLKGDNVVSLHRRRPRH